MTATSPLDYWSVVTDITDRNGARTSTEPGAVSFRDQLYVFYRGTSDEGTVYACVSPDGKEWSQQRNITAANNARTGGIPVPVVFMDRLFLVFQGNTDPTRLYVCSTADGTGWSALSEISAQNNAQTSTTPAPVVFGNKLYVFYRGTSDKGTVYAVSTSDGTHWSGQQTNITAANGARTDVGLVPVVFRDRLFVFFREKGDAGDVAAFSTADGVDWASPGVVRFGDARTSHSPAPVVFDGRLFVFFRGTSDDGNLSALVSEDGHAWSPRKDITARNHARTSHTPVPAICGEQLFVFYRGSSDTQGVYAFPVLDADHYEAQTRITDRNDARTAGQLFPAVVDGRLALVFRIAGDSGALGAFQLTRPDPWNVRLVDVPKAFGAVSDEGVYDYAYLGPNNPNPLDHIQGMSGYRRWYLFPRNYMESKSGKVFVVDKQREISARDFDTPDTGDNHPSGSQVIGDYLALPVEGDGKGAVYFYDLSRMSTDTLPALVPHLRVDAPAGAGAVGITDIGQGPDRQYVLAVCDTGSVTVFVSTPGPLTAPIRFEERFTADVGSPGPDSMQLLTDVNDRVYLVSLTTDDSVLTAWKDWILLYEVDFTNKRFNRLSERQMYTKAETIPNPIHFRFGAGVSIVDPTRLQFYCSDRNGDPTGLGRFGYNTFS